MPFISSGAHPADVMAVRMEAPQGDTSVWEPEDHVIHHLLGALPKFKVGDTFYEEEDEYVTDAEAFIIKETEHCWFRLHIEASFWAASKKVEVYWWLDASDHKDFAETTSLDKGKCSFTEGEWPTPKEIIQRISKDMTLVKTINSLFI